MWNKIRFYQAVLYFVAIKSPRFPTVIDRFGFIISSIEIVYPPNAHAQTLAVILNST